MEMYATAERFAQLYPSAPSDAYTRFSWEAQKRLDDATTTVDGVKKLQIAFPIDEYTADAVERCMCAVINALQEIDTAKQAANAASGYVQEGDGYRSANVRSISAGGESITYGSDAGAETDIARAARSNNATKQYINDIIQQYFRGLKDANDVNLLYGGAYRRWCRCSAGQ